MSHHRSFSGGVAEGFRFGIGVMLAQLAFSLAIMLIVVLFGVMRLLAKSIASFLVIIFSLLRRLIQETLFQVSGVR